MADQHDMVLDDAGGAGFLSDLNLALMALAKLSNGATEPATKHAYMWWADTTTGLLKIRNAANSAWIEVGTLATIRLGLALADGSWLQDFSTNKLTASGGGQFSGEAAVTVASDNVRISANMFGAGYAMLDFIDASRTANDRISGLLWDSGVLSFRFVNDAYGAATSFMDVAGGYAAGTTSIVMTAPLIKATGAYSTTTASAANMFVDTDGTLKRSTSSQEFKTAVEDMDVTIAQRLVEQFRAVWYRSLCPGDKPDWSFYGAIAEEVALIDPRFVHWGYKDADYEEVQVDDGETEEPVMETVTELGIEVVNGVPVARQVTRQIPCFEMVQVVDEAGNAIEGLTHPVPVMVKTKKTRKERRLKATAVPSPIGLQYERFTVPLMVVARAREARIAALEKLL